MANFDNFGNYGGQYGIPMYQQIAQQMQPMPRIPEQTDGRIWVANEQAAESYLVAANSFVRLWDSNKNVFYEKRADATGRLFPMESYEYRKISPKTAEKTSEATIDYQKQIDGLNGRILALEEAIKNGKSDADAE